MPSAGREKTASCFVSTEQAIANESVKKYLRAFVAVALCVALRHLSPNNNAAERKSWVTSSICPHKFPPTRVEGSKAKTNVAHGACEMPNPRRRRYINRIDRVSTAPKKS
jgi:hypothetical protein